MKIKSVLAALFLGVLFGGQVSAMGDRLATDQAAAPKAEKVASNAVIAYYFHGNVRCYKCTSMEAYADEALKTGFPKDLESGRLIWRPTNIDLPKNKHFVKDYKLVTRSLVLVEAKDGKQVRWKNLPKIWELVGDKDAFIKYVQKEAEVFIKGEK